MLGSIEVWRDGRPLVVAAGKQRALLAYLLIHRNRVVLRDELIDALWGAQPPATAIKNLQVLVSQLRRSLGNDAITTVGGGYMLPLSEQATDVDRYERLVEAGRGELDQGHATQAQQTFEDALGLWRGAPYADVAYEDFAADEIARLEARRLSGEEERYEAMLAAGRHSDAVAGLEQLVSRHPFRERLTAELMVALHRSSRRAAALEAYDSLRRRMSEELGIEPGEQVRSLHASILQDEPAGEQPALAVSPPSTRRRRRAALMMLAGAIALLAAAVLAFLQSTGTDSLARVAGDHVGSIDAGSGRVTAQYAVGATPTAVAAHNGAAWTLNGDAGTISRVDMATGASMERSPGVIPTDLSYGGGALWVGYVTRNPETGAVRAGVLDLDPDTLRERRRLALKGERESGVNQTSATLVSFGNGALYVASPLAEVLRIDPDRMEVTASASLEVNAFTAGLGGVWVVPGNGRSFANTTTASGARVVRLHPITLRRVGGTAVSSPSGLFDLALGDGAVWAAEPFAGQVWRIDPGPPFETATFDVGNSAASVAYGDGRLWVANGVDGTVSQIEASSGELTAVPVGGVPQGVACRRPSVGHRCGQLGGGPLSGHADAAAFDLRSGSLSGYRRSRHGAGQRPAARPTVRRPDHSDRQRDRARVARAPISRRPLSGGVPVVRRLDRAGGHGELRQVPGQRAIVRRHGQRDRGDRHLQLGLRQGRTADPQQRR